MAQTHHLIDEILSDPAVRGGRPVLKGTGFKVSDVVINYYTNGDSAEDIAEHWGYRLGQVFAALAYYQLNKNEIDAQIEHDHETAQRLLSDLASQGKLK
jgi:uncharacterized protein (DUF433 family)